MAMQAYPFSIMGFRRTHWRTSTRGFSLLFSVAAVGLLACCCGQLVRPREERSVTHAAAVAMLGLATSASRRSADATVFSAPFVDVSRRDAVHRAGFRILDIAPRVHRHAG